MRRRRHITKIIAPWMTKAGVVIVITVMGFLLMLAGEAFFNRLSRMGLTPW